MKEKVVKAAQDTAVLLLEEQKKLLNTLADVGGLLQSQEQDGKERVLDRERVAEIVEVLDGEADKVKRLEITLAVAGTVKAGKSTVVNAIVGAEVLPNRARPMTALPTVIRHQLDLQEPRLTINNHVALNEMARQISEKLQTEDCLTEVQTSHNIDMKALIDDLAERRPLTIGARHQGRHQAFEVLGRINDLLRLGRHEAVRVELPLEDYDDLGEMPSLAVHFRCLAEAASNTGSFALLDLPGFNEARSSQQLTAVLREQLEKASAILVILDYTQLNTEASDELEVLIDAVSGMMTDRIFVLVNKFDECTANDAYRDERILRDHISADTMRGHVSPHHVYPVSAQRAYLANRALEALERKGRLPSPSDEAWVADFGDLVFPMATDTQLADLCEVDVRKAADTLWIKSRFETPLMDVVVAAQTRAATLALQSTLGKLTTYGEKMENHLNLTLGSLTKDIQDLNSVIDRMDTDGQHITKTKNDFDTMFNKAIAQIERKVQQQMAASQDKVDRDFDDLFNDLIETIIKAKKLRSKSSNERRSTLLSRIRTRFVEEVMTLKKDDSWDDLRDDFIQNGKVEYEDEQKYRETQVVIRGMYSTISGELLDALRSDVQAVLDAERKRTGDELNRLLNGITAKVQENMSQAGIRVTLGVPEMELGKQSIKTSPIRLDGKKETRTETYRAVGDGWISRGLNWIDTGWGLEEVEVEKNYYVIHRDKMDAVLKRGLEKSLKVFQDYVNEQMNAWHGSCDAKFVQVETELNRYYQALVDGIGERKRDRHNVKRIVDKAKHLQNESEYNRAKVRDFEEITKVL